MKAIANSLNRGSIWCRWEPHVHHPGTVLNDQFKGLWDDYISKLEASNPAIQALGVTDYYLSRGYEQVREAKKEGRLAGIDLIFPNIELRLSVGTTKGRWVNIHLLVSPEDPEHIDQVNRFLARLRFPAFNDQFACTREDLIRLGKAANAALNEDEAALSHGASQFKVDFNQLREEFHRSSWAKQNILIAVAGSQTDGSSGVRDAADFTLRQEIEKFANIIFASSAAQQEFWLGMRSATPEELRNRYGGLKPCLHGSDGHDIPSTGAPIDCRFSWIKGELTFESLRQACIDPPGRAFVGNAPPSLGIPSQIIDQIEVKGAPWLKTPKVALNSGLVAIIGPRGSGKTALAEIIAAACDAISHNLGDEKSERLTPSFLTRARSFLTDASVSIKWRSGDTLERKLNSSMASEFAIPRARYLSQEFVERLCSSYGIADSLFHEIERVIFESYPLAERDGATDFAELLELGASRFRQMRQREEEALVQLSERIALEFEKDASQKYLRQQIAQKKDQIIAWVADRLKLTATGSAERMKQLGRLAEAAESVRGYLKYFKNKQQALLGLQDEVETFRRSSSPELLRQLKARFAAADLKKEQWDAFLVDYKGNVGKELSASLIEARKSAEGWKGDVGNAEMATKISQITDLSKLKKYPLSALETETQRLQKLINADSTSQRQFATLSNKINVESAMLEVLTKRLLDAEGAKERIRELQQERELIYKRIFDAIIQEQTVLTSLYQPLMERLSAATGTIRKLAFTVSRIAQVDVWAAHAEENLVDLRRQGPFRGRGRLGQIAAETLKEAWERGDANIIAQAMDNFRQQYQNDLLAHANVSANDQLEYRAWLKRFAQWLYSTMHIELRYSIDYDGIDIRKLSPGTRGIVLLLLYLALDDKDDRPLIIDQPEENLDPKSVYDDLVSLFIDAKSRRQVIIVSHNANLVVNTDADQIIVADVGLHTKGELPHISYKTGGLENQEIRESVCRILEGGEEAFRERARRMRVKFS